MSKKGSSSGESAQEKIDQLTEQLSTFSIKERGGRGVTLPERFDGDRRKLQNFITKCRMFFVFKKDDYPEAKERALYVASLLTGVAFSWIKPRVREAIEKPYAQ